MAPEGEIPCPLFGAPESTFNSNLTNAWQSIYSNCLPSFGAPIVRVTQSRVTQSPHIRHTILQAAGAKNTRLIPHWLIVCSLPVSQCHMQLSSDGDSECHAHSTAHHPPPPQEAFPHSTQTHTHMWGYANFNRCIANIYVPFNAVTVGGEWGAVGLGGCSGWCGSWPVTGNYEPEFKGNGISHRHRGELHNRMPF